MRAEPWDNRVPWDHNGPIRPVVYPTRPGEELVDEFSPAKPKRKIGGPRPGMFQGLRMTGSWIPGNDVSNFGLSDVDINLTLGFPFPSRDAPLIITPGFQAWSLDGPQGPDMPARVYDAYLKFRTMRKLGQRWGMDLAVTPGWHSDFQTSNDAALRITGHGFLAYDWPCARENVQVVMGFVYLDRNDVSWLPAAGLIWRINEDSRLEIIMPRPRYLRRICASECDEWWWYLAGEFGGGNWAIERADGSQDVASYRDWRVLMGWEHKVCDGFGSHFEIGYVFGRNIEYESATPDFEPDSTLMVRAGVTY